MDDGQRVDEPTEPDEPVKVAPAGEAGSRDADAATGYDGERTGYDGAGVSGTDPVVAAIFRAFFVGGRLQTMPAKRSKRLVVLDHIARVFEPGVRYPESEVNTILLGFHPDFAMVRRYLVDEQFLTRDHGIYWRIGGSVDV